MLLSILFGALFTSEHRIYGAGLRSDLEKRLRDLSIEAPKETIDNVVERNADSVLEKLTNDVRNEIREAEAKSVEAEVQTTTFTTSPKNFRDSILNPDIEFAWRELVQRSFPTATDGNQQASDDESYETLQLSTLKDDLEKECFRILHDKHLTLTGNRRKQFFEILSSMELEGFKLSLPNEILQYQLNEDELNEQIAINIIRYCKYFFGNEWNEHIVTYAINGKVHDFIFQNIDWNDNAQHKHFRDFPSGVPLYITLLLHDHLPPLTEQNKTFFIEKILPKFDLTEIIPFRDFSGQLKHGNLVDILVHLLQFYKTQLKTLNKREQISQRIHRKRDWTIWMLQEMLSNGANPVLESIESKAFS